jgi:hypothetical protein
MCIGRTCRFAVTLQRRDLGYVSRSRGKGDHQPFKASRESSQYVPNYRGRTPMNTTGVKAVALMSTFAAIGDFSIPPEKQKGRVYTENDWQPDTEEEKEKLDGTGE